MKDKDSANYVLLAVLIIILFATGYAYLLRINPPEITSGDEVGITAESASESAADEYITIKVFFPDGKRLRMEERELPRVFSQKKILKGTLKEFLNGPTGVDSHVIPDETVLLSVYLGSDGIAYINLSEEFRRNFHGDAVDEYLLLKGLYESTISNTQVDDIKVLIEGKEVDAIGGHFPADRPLKRIVVQEIKFD
jgi:spore germination protein GerM